MRRLLLVAVTLALVATGPAQAAEPRRTAERAFVHTGELSYPPAVKRALRYLPPDGFVLHYSRASRRVIHIKMAEDATPENDWFGLPPEFWEEAIDPMWITVYTVRYQPRQVLVCVGGLGVVERFPR